MSRSKFIPRLVLTLCLMGTFAYAAFFLFQKQSFKLTYLSFQLENSTSVVVPNMDKLFAKISNLDDLEVEGLPESIIEASQSVLANRDVQLKKILGNSCFLSFNETDFNLVFSSSNAPSQILADLNLAYSSAFQLKGQDLEVGGKKYVFNQVGSFILIGTSQFIPKETKASLNHGNADYVVYLPADSLGSRHILSKDYHYVLNEKRSEKLVGKAVNPAGYFAIAPGVFDYIEFYGSTRITEDQESYFKGATADAYAWLDDGLLYCRKDSFELVIARQGVSRDLGLMLEESTSNLQEDANVLPSFNIGKFKILAFSSEYDWQHSLAPLKNELKFYTEHQEYNVMTNSVAAMRWYLGLIQLGNVFEKNANDYQVYADCLPQNVHRISLTRTDSSFDCSSGIYQFGGKMLHTFVSAKNTAKNMQSVELMRDFNVTIVPKYIQVIGKYPNENILLSSNNAIGMFDSKGIELWKLNLSSSLVQSPQIVDFEADGLSEFILFQENQVDVVNVNGKSLPGFPVSLKGLSSSGLAVNYDNSNNYRIIVHSGETIALISEEGKFVDGWKFGGMTASIQGAIYHVQTDGKDIIAFKDQNENQYVLSRNGESRMATNVKFELKNETDFVIGGLSSSLRKMGYADGYIYNYYVLDGEKDSVKVDKTINPVKIHWEYNGGNPLMIAEETDRLLIVDQFGYVKSEVLKPSGSNTFVGLVGSKEFGFVFADNGQNSIYLLNNYGKMMLPVAVSGSSVSIINGDLLYTFSGISIKAYKI